MFKVVRLEEFEKTARKLLSRHELERLSKIEKEISEKGFTGDTLGFPFLREKKISGKRVYFLVYAELRVALMVSVSDKKTQQREIEKIKELLPGFKKLVEGLT